jgi:hypothetical protein
MGVVAVVAVVTSPRTAGCSVDSAVVVVVVVERSGVVVVV